MISCSARRLGGRSVTMGDLVFGVIVPAGVFILSFCLTFALYRHFTRNDK